MLRNTTPSAPPADLAGACDWAVRHAAWIGANAARENWDDERLSAECDKTIGVMARATRDPSQGALELAAKANLLRADFLRHRVEGAELDQSDMLLLSLLEDVTRLCRSSAVMGSH